MGKIIDSSSNLELRGKPDVYFIIQPPVMISATDDGLEPVINTLNAPNRNITELSGLYAGLPNIPRYGAGDISALLLPFHRAHRFSSISDDTQTIKSCLPC